MNKVFNLKTFQERRRRLRKSMPDGERILWSKLNRKQMNGYRFRRQASIGKYIVDFYCPKLKLAIEVDGDQHFWKRGTIEYDQKRQKEIESLGIKFLRFETYEIYKNIDGVANTIWLYTEKNSKATPS